MAKDKTTPARASSRKASKPPSRSNGKTTGKTTGMTTGKTVNVSMGFGQLKISVPPGTAATIVPSVKAGQIVVHRPGEDKAVHTGLDAENAQPITVGSGDTKVTLNVSMVAGEIVVTEESS